MCVHVCLCWCVCIHVCVCLCMYVCVCKCECILCVHGVYVSVYMWYNNSGARWPIIIPSQRCLDDTCSIKALFERKASVFYVTIDRATVHGGGGAASHEYMWGVVIIIYQ